MNRCKNGHHSDAHSSSSEEEEYDDDVVIYAENENNLPALCTPSSLTLQQSQSQSQLSQSQCDENEVAAETYVVSRRERRMKRLKEQKERRRILMQLAEEEENRGGGVVEEENDDGDGDEEIVLGGEESDDSSDNDDIEKEKDGEAKKEKMKANENSSPKAAIATKKSNTESKQKEEDPFSFIHSYLDSAQYSGDDQKSTAVAAAGTNSTSPAKNKNKQHIESEHEEDDDDVRKNECLKNNTIQDGTKYDINLSQKYQEPENDVDPPPRKMDTEKDKQQQVEGEQISPVVCDFTHYDEDNNDDDDDDNGDNDDNFQQDMVITHKLHDDVNDNEIQTAMLYQNKKKLKGKKINKMKDEMLEENNQESQVMMSVARKRRRRHERAALTDHQSQSQSFLLGDENNETFSSSLNKLCHSQFHVSNSAKKKKKVKRDAAIGVKKAKSIVGSRPQHWGRTKNNAHIISQSSASSASSSSSMANALSKATKVRIGCSYFGKRGRRSIGDGHNRSLSQMNNSSSFSAKNQKSQSGVINSRDTSSFSLEQSKQLLQQQSNVSSTDTKTKTSATKSQKEPALGVKWEQNVDVRKMKFSPSFLPAKKLKRGNSVIVDDAVTDDALLLPDEENNADPLIYASQACLSPNPALRTPHSAPDSNENNFIHNSNGSAARSPLLKHSSARKRKKAGPLMAQLRSIRGSIEGDWVRFQSGTYPYRDPSKRRLDVNDPRNRAESYMDVTILGVPTQWNGSEGSKKMIVLGYIHNREHIKKKVDLPSSQRNTRLRTPGSQMTTEANNDGTNKSQIDDNDNNNTYQRDTPYPAWISFMYDTVREQRITTKSQLRIYNAVIVSKDDPLSPSSSASAFPMVLCTQLCESYPSVLPPLPKVDAQLICCDKTINAPC